MQALMNIKKYRFLHTYVVERIQEIGRKVYADQIKKKISKYFFSVTHGTKTINKKKFDNS